jgi:hypothetical protein
MISFVGAGTQEIGAIYGVGLSRDDLLKLIAGEEILVDLFDLGGPAISVLILAGHDDSAMIRRLERQGSVDANTDVRTVPRET